MLVQCFFLSSISWLLFSSIPSFNLIVCHFGHVPFHISSFFRFIVFSIHPLTSISISLISPLPFHISFAPIISYHIPDSCIYLISNSIHHFARFELEAIDPIMYACIFFPAAHSQCQQFFCTLHIFRFIAALISSDACVQLKHHTIDRFEGS